MKHTEADKVVANSNRDLEKCVLLRFTKISATCEKCSISTQRVHFVSILSMQFTKNPIQLKEIELVLLQQ